MSSVWVSRRPRNNGGTSYRVMFRVGGRESAPRYGGAFARMREAKIRRDWIAGELAAMRVPDLRLVTEGTAARTLRDAATRWHANLFDLADSTRVQYRQSLAHALMLFGDRRVDAITAGDVAELVAGLKAKEKKRETIRKAVDALAKVLDHAGVTPNPARDKVQVRLPRGDAEDPSPPTAEHLVAVYALLPARYRLPLLVLDATGMRLGELEQLGWGDIDEGRSRWRVRAEASKTRRARWVEVPPAIFAAVLELVPRDDRTPERRVFQGFGGARFRTQITRSCVGSGVPAFSPHDLRHRRISLLHLAGVPWARIGEHVGQRDLSVTANTYTHVLIDERELDYVSLLALGVTGRDRAVQTPVQTPEVGIAD